MSRDRVARMVCYVFGTIPIMGLIYFARMPKAAALDFRGQMGLSRFAFWMAIAAGVVCFSGFFRQAREIRILTMLYGAGMGLLWLIIAAGHLPVARTCDYVFPSRKRTNAARRIEVW